jgi:hypothetical protein
LTEHNNGESSSYPILFVAVAILIVVALAASLYFSTDSRSSGSTSATTTEQSSSITTTMSISTTSTGRFSAPDAAATTLSKTWDSWNYTISLNATNVKAGELILIRSMLTYTGQNSTRVALSAPYAQVRDLNAGGKLVWEYISGGVYYPRNFSKGESTSSNVYIPTSGFKPGIYAIYAEPGLDSYPDFQDLGVNLQIKTNFTVISSTTTANENLPRSPTNTTTAISNTTGSDAPVVVRVSDRNYLRTEIIPVFNNIAENSSLVNQKDNLTIPTKQSFIETSVNRAEKLGLDEGNLRDILTKLVFHIDQLNFTGKNTFTDNEGKITEVSFRISNSTVQLPGLIEKAKYMGVDAWIIVLNWANQAPPQSRLSHVATIVFKYGSDEVLFAESCI